jgi:DinB superfamily
VRAEDPLNQRLSAALIIGVMGIATAASAQNPDETRPLEARAPSTQSPDETSAREKKAVAQQREAKQPAQQQGEIPPLEDTKAEQNPTAAEMSAKESVASSLLRNFQYEEYELRSAAEAMPVEKYNFRPKPGDFGGVYPGYGLKELRTFAEQIKHVACANFAFAAELDGKQPPPACDTGGSSPAKTRDELLVYLRDSFKTLKTSLGAITQQNMFDPIEGPYAGPNTRLGLAEVCIWHVADHYGQLVLYMRLNGLVPPASRPNPPQLKD